MHKLSPNKLIYEAGFNNSFIRSDQIHLHAAFVGVPPSLYFQNSLSLSLTHTHARTHAREHTKTHTLSLCMFWPNWPSSEV
jgi:hypothetical protein